MSGRRGADGGTDPIGRVEPVRDEPGRGERCRRTTLERDRASRRAGRLLRWYPAAWRARYGEELAELLTADLQERPRAAGRHLDLARNGLLARLTGVGLAGSPAVTMAQAQGGLAMLGWACGAFLLFGVAIWAQLAVDWQWSPPATPVTSLAMTAMSAAVAALAALGLLAAAPVLWTLGRSLVRRPLASGLLLPSLLLVTGTVVLVLGSRHFGNGWPGTGGHPWARQGLVPGGMAAFGWAATLAVTSYWAHPAALGAFPPAELSWMVVSPLAVAAVLSGAARAVRRTPLSARILRHESRIGVAAAAAMTVFLAAAGCWVLDGGPGPRGLFRTGGIDVGGLLVMAVALALAVRVVVRTRRIGWAGGCH